MANILTTYNREKLRWPTCGLCNKPVDRMEQHPVFPNPNKIIVIAYCHGAEDKIEIDTSELIRSNNFTFNGIAFNQKHLIGEI